MGGFSLRYSGAKFADGIPIRQAERANARAHEVPESVAPPYRTRPPPRVRTPHHRTQPHPPLAPSTAGPYAVLAHHTTGGASNGPTGAVSLPIEKIRLVSATGTSYPQARQLPTTAPAPNPLNLTLPLPHRPHLTPPSWRCCDDRLNPSCVKFLIGTSVRVDRPLALGLQCERHHTERSDP